MVAFGEKYNLRIVAESVIHQVLYASGDVFQRKSLIEK